MGTCHRISTTLFLDVEVRGLVEQLRPLRIIPFCSRANRKAGGRNGLEEERGRAPPSVAKVGPVSTSSDWSPESELYTRPRLCRCADHGAGEGDPPGWSEPVP